MSNLDFELCRNFTNEYFYLYHNDNIRSFSYRHSNLLFFMWEYYNNDDDFDPFRELKTILDLAKDFHLYSKGWSKPILRAYKSSCNELFDNIASIIFSRR